MYDICKSLARILGYGYAAFTGALFVLQRNLQYVPTKAQPPRVSTIFPNLADLEDFSVITKDGVHLEGWYLPSRVDGKHSNISLLHLHGNAGNRFHRLSWAVKIREHFGCGVALLDYRGYGGNEGFPSENGLILDASAGISWHVSTNGQNKTKVVLHLESIGSAAGLNALRTVDRNIRTAISGIVIEGGLSSCLDVARDKLKLFPLSLLMFDKWNQTCKSASAIDRHTHLLSLHGSNDCIVPVKFGKKLFDSTNCLVKDFITLAGVGHNDLATHTLYFNLLDAFYSRLD
jgi:uncharacterized protein